MADLQREKDERVEKTPTEEKSQESPQGNLRRDDDSKVEEKNRGTANSDMGKKDSDLGRGSSSNVGSGSNLGSQTPGRTTTGTSQTPGRDVNKDKDINKPGMNR
jgi:hypothetical protein